LVNEQGGNMKKYYLIAGFISCLFLFNSCEESETITVENKSEYEVKDITLEYSVADGAKTSKINSLMPDRSKPINVVLQKGGIMNAFTSPVKIEYYINGEKFDVNNEEHANKDSGGNVTTNALIGSGSLVIKIYNETYTVNTNR
jgi:hypothetical protein